MNDGVTLADVRAVEYLDWNNDELWPCYLGAGFRLHDGRFVHWSLSLDEPLGRMQGCQVYPVGAF
jgi:hypothetical protein